MLCAASHRRPQQRASSTLSPLEKAQRTSASIIDIRLPAVLPGIKSQRSSPDTFPWRACFVPSLAAKQTARVQIRAHDCSRANQKNSDNVRCTGLRTIVTKRGVSSGVRHMAFSGLELVQAYGQLGHAHRSVLLQLRPSLLEAPRELRQAAMCPLAVAGLLRVCTWKPQISDHWRNLHEVCACAALLGTCTYTRTVGAPRPRRLRDQHFSNLDSLHASR